MLLEAGADAGRRNVTNLTPAGIAERRGMPPLPTAFVAPKASDQRRRQAKSTNWTPLRTTSCWRTTRYEPALQRLREHFKPPALTWDEVTRVRELLSAIPREQRPQAAMYDG
jgi:hypothetical protein